MHHYSSSSAYRPITCGALTALLLLGSFDLGHARNGFIPHYVGIEGIIGGAGTACPLDATSIIANPAALTRVPNHIIFTLGFIYQKQHVDTSKTRIGNSIGRQTNRYKTIPVATLGFNYRLNERWMVGFGSTGGGGFVKFKRPVNNPASLVPAGDNFNKHTVNAVTLSAPTLSYTPSAWHGYGISLLIATSSFKSDLAMPDNTEVKGGLRLDRIVGVGTRIGGIWDVHKCLTVGMSAATPVWGQLHHKYKQLFQKKFQIPPTFRFGITWHATPKTDVSLDYKVLFYGLSKWVRNGQGWRNQPIFLAGVLHHLTDQLMVGVGYNYAKMPMGKDKVIFNTLSIPLDEHHFSGGFNYKVANNKVEIFVMGYYIPKKKVKDNGKGLSITGLPPGPSKGTKLDNFSFGGEIGIKYNF
jgi:long-chain fatty acid transport protein